MGVRNVHIRRMDVYVTGCVIWVYVIGLFGVRLDMTLMN
jgi:hypothetical protein